MVENTVVRASKILEHAISIADGGVKSRAVALLNKDVSPTWFYEVEKLRKYMADMGISPMNDTFMSPIRVPAPQRTTISVTQRRGLGLFDVTIPSWYWFAGGAFAGGILVYFLMIQTERR
jgi:hypothetical protein